MINLFLWLVGIPLVMAGYVSLDIWRQTNYRPWALIAFSCWMIGIAMLAVGVSGILS